MKMLLFQREKIGMDISDQLRVGAGHQPKNCIMLPDILAVIYARTEISGNIRLPRLEKPRFNGVEIHQVKVSLAILREYPFLGKLLRKLPYALSSG